MVKDHPFLTAANIINEIELTELNVLFKKHIDLHSNPVKR